MKSEELMVGDYLTFRDVQNDSNCPKARVIAINEEDVYVSIDGDPIADLCDPKELAGIPIIPAILEKNGFKSNDNMFGFQDYELSKDFLLENRGERYCLVKSLPGHRLSAFFINEVRFIHELQHYLKLFGIDKTIEL